LEPGTATGPTCAEGATLSRSVCEPKVHELGVPIFGEEEVFGFQVTVDDVFFMQGGQPFGSTESNFARKGFGSRPIGLEEGA
jgi:hypothetical protein